MKILILSLLCASFVNVEKAETNAPLESRIIGGNEVILGKRPYIVSLRNNGTHFCSGSLISPTNVLTAAQCLILFKNKEHEYKDLTVVANTIYSKGDDGISRPIFYIDYNSHFAIELHFLSRSDIALASVLNPFELSIDIKSIVCIEDNAHIPSYANVDVAGWGSQQYFTTYETPIPSPILKETTLMILPHSECKIRLAAYNIDFYANQICTFPRYQLTNTAQGDGGSPLIFRGKLIGIHSHNIPVGIYTPSIYTRVSKFKGYIENAKRRAKAFRTLKEIQQENEISESTSACK